MKEEKICGAVDLDKEGNFIGFSKIMFETDTLKVDILLNGEKIDSIIADKTINELDYKFEMFNLEGHCFSYPIPKNLKKDDKLEFLTKDNTPLLNSPVII